MKKRITSFEIALSALACGLATISLTLGVYSNVLLFTGYLVACIVFMLPLYKQSYVGYVLAYIATCILAFIFNVARFWDVLPFVMFFGLHPLVNELQLKTKINRWLACFIKAVWFDVTMYLIWRFVFRMTTTFPLVDAYILPIILVFGSVFFVFYDYSLYKARAAVNILLQRIKK